MPLARIFDECFAPLMGRPCWQVSIGYADCVRLDFGEPHLEIRDPTEAIPGSSQRVRELFARRRVTVRGEWHLWIYGCNWSILNGGQVVCDSEDADSVDAAAQWLDGQAFTGVSIDESARTRFTFDLGGVLATSPFDDESDQWMLYEPDDGVLTLRADARYQHFQSGDATHAEQWCPIWEA